jgi:hypothetical protein
MLLRACFSNISFWFVEETRVPAENRKPEYQQKINDMANQSHWQTNHSIHTIIFWGHFFLSFHYTFWISSICGHTISLLLTVIPLVDWSTTKKQHLVNTLQGTYKQYLVSVDQAVIKMFLYNFHLVQCLN